MASTIVDLATYGDAKGRDNYMRNSFFSLKSDGVSATELTQGFYGVLSSDDTDYELGRITVSEATADSQVGTIAFGVTDGSLNDVMVLNNTESTITTTLLNLTAADVVASGTLHIGTITKDDTVAALGQGVSVELVDDDVDAAINFVVGDLSATPAPTLIITDDTVAVAGTLTVDGTDILATITGGNLWESTGVIGQLKTAYTSIEVNVVNAYTTSLALDVNGSTRIRGNDVLFYDDTLFNHYSVLSYDPTATEVYLRASRAGDSLILQTTDGNNNTWIDRLTFDSGSSTQNVTFTDAFVGIGAASSGTYPLEVTGGASLTAGLLTGGDVDVAGNNLVNVTNIDSDATASLSDQVRITLTSSDTVPQLDVILGDLDVSTVTAMTLTDVAATVNVPTTVTSNLTVTGDLTVSGTTVTLNTSEVAVEDINIVLASAALTAGVINGGGITLGPLVTDITGSVIPAITFNSTTELWDSTLGISVAATSNFTVGTTVVEAAGITMTAAAPYVYFGAASEWRLGIYSDVSGDHFTIDHEDGAGYVTKFDVLE